MTCRKCGAPLPNGQAFCSRCGTPVTNNAPTPYGTQPQMPPADPRMQYQNAYRDPYQSQNGPSIDPNFLNSSGGGSQNPTLLLVVRILFGIFAAAYLIFAAKGLIGTLYHLLVFIKDYIILGFRYYGLGFFNKLVYILRLLVQLVAYAGFLFMGATLGVTSYNPIPEHARGHFAGICISALAILVFFPLQYLLYLASGFASYFSYSNGSQGTALLLTLACALLVTIISFILMSLIGKAPITTFSTAVFKEAAGEILPTLTKDIENLNLGKKDKDSDPAAKDPGLDKSVQPHRPSFSAQPSHSAQPSLYGPNHSTIEPRFPLQSDRSFFKYLILSLLTCGIYDWFFLGPLYRDLNIALDGDGGAEIADVITTFGYNILSFDLYHYCLYFNLANRLHANGIRYGVDIEIDGKTYLLWSVTGRLLFWFIGPWIGFYKILEASNAICDAYNKLHGLN